MQAKYKESIKIYWYSFRKLIEFGKWSVPAIILLQTIIELLTVLSTYLFGKLLGAFITDIKNFEIYSQPTLSVTLKESMSLRYLAYMSLVWVLKHIVTNIITPIDEYYHSIMLNRFQILISTKFSKLNLEEIESNNIYDLITKIQSFWYSRFDTLLSILKSIFGSTMGLISVLALLLKENSLSVFLISLTIIPKVILLFVLANENLNRIKRTGKARVLKAYTFNIILDVRTFAEKKINNLFSRLLDNLHQYGNFLSKEYLNITNLSTINLAISDLLGQIVLYINQFGIVNRIITKRVGIPEGINYINYLSLLLDKLNNLTTQVSTFFTLEPYLKYLYEYENISTLHEDNPGTTRLSTPITTIDIINLSVCFPGNNTIILSNINLSIKKGEKILILGKDGEGKSSIIKTFSGLYRIRHGDIFINNLSIKDISPGQWKDCISAVLDDFGRYYYSIKENIIMSKPTSSFDPKLYNKALSASLLDKWLEQNKIEDTQLLGKIYPDGTEIPSGYWQRITLARAIYSDKPVILLDEPFTFIDSKTREQLLSNMMKIWADRIIIMIDEDPKFARYFHKVYKICNSTIVPA